MTYGKPKFGLLSKRSFLAVVSSLMLVTPLAFAHAGFFSQIKNFLTGNRIFYASQREENSQNMPLLQAAVHSDPNPAKGGGGIIIDRNMALAFSGGQASVGGAEEQVSQSGQVRVYTVQPGDSLSTIAEMFGVTVDTIRWANDIGANDLIRVGQELVILPVSGVKYTVKEGDTVSSIALRFKAKTDDILEFNGLDPKRLAVGQEIIIPNGVMRRPSRANHTGSRMVRGADAPEYRGYYRWPLQGGRITQGLHGYNAVDIGAPVGTPVYASANGTVEVSKYRDGNPWFGGYGNYIVLRHSNGTQTLYAHLSGVAVHRGWNVVQGQIIGYVGSTGRSTGPHLHFEVRGARNPFGR